MSGRPSGLGRGIAALIPVAAPDGPSREQTSGSAGDEPSTITVLRPAGAQADESTARPTDVFFAGSKRQSKASAWDSAAAGGRIGLAPVKPALAPVEGARYAELPIESIQANKRQPRTHFAEAELAELVASVAEIGVLQPIVVRPSGSGYELIMGERRWRAATAAKLGRIPAIIRDTEDTAMLRDALLENLHRANLNPLEEASAYHQLLEDFGCSQEELAQRIARSRPQISNTLRLLKLPALVQKRLAAGAITAGHARALLALPTDADMEMVAQQIVAEGMSVRAVEDLVAALSAKAERKPARRYPGAHFTESKELAGRLTERLSSPVQVRVTPNGGRVTIGFANIPELNRILTLIAPEERGLPEA